MTQLTRDRAIAGAERALRRTMQAARLEPIALLTDPKRRSRVVRCSLAGAKGLPTVVVKTFEGGGGTQLSPRIRFETERASLELLGTLGDPPLAPRLYAAHRGSLSLVMEDLGTPATLADALLGANAREAERALIAFARCLGDQHARTASRRARAAPARGTAGPSRIDPSVIGLALDEPVRRELADLERGLASPAFRAFTHLDPCPDNCFREGERYRFIDFEFGGYRHALLDGVYWHTQFPTCWCANLVPRRLVARLEAAYRDELARGCPAARDDRAFELAVVRGAAARTFDVLVNASWWLEKDRQWGIATVRQRLPTRFRSFAALARSRGLYPALADLADRASVAIADRFVPDPLPVYPALRAPRPSARPRRPRRSRS